jgi:hypothetical protein
MHRFYDVIVESVDYSMKIVVYAKSAKDALRQALTEAA